MPAITIRADRRSTPQGPLFGIFFEDLNRAADGGLYAECVINGGFAFDPVDNRTYTPLTGWEAVGGADIAVVTDAPLFAGKPQSLRLVSSGAGAGVVNAGYNTGIPLRGGEDYRFSVWVRCAGEMTMTAALASAAGEVYCAADFAVSGGWRKYQLTLTAVKDDFCGRLVLTCGGAGEVWLDRVSLFPAETFLGRDNGMRRDIAQLLADMKPKFMRFPGGCLVHCGDLEADSRTSMYRWKNAVGPVEKRPARRNNWGYCQTLGLGFYEYFRFCEDIGATPLPVLPGGSNPHSRKAAEGVLLEEFVQDALDLIEFANGDVSTPWGAVRADMGHPAPFGLRYIAIGNEEVGEEFYSRLPLFVKAIREKYPEIRIIGSSGPFVAGGEFERGWNSARELQVDAVDEHYYAAPEWYWAHMDRYARYPKGEPKVFLGEYASWGNALENALTEAAYMTVMQENADAVELACYAPLLANVDYIAWRPDMIYYDNHRAFGTANYHVQKMFMAHQGDYLLESRGEGLEAPPADRTPITGGLFLETNRTRFDFRDIVLTNTDTGETVRYDDRILEGHDPDVSTREHLGETGWSRYSLSMRVQRLGGWRGLVVGFGYRDDQNYHTWGFGGWENQDTLVEKKNRGKGSCLTESEFMVGDGVYDLRLEVDGRMVRTYIDGKLANEIEDTLPCLQPLYWTATVEEGGDMILKAVNLLDRDCTADIAFEGISGPLTGTVYTMAGDPAAENSFDEPDKVVPVPADFAADAAFAYTFPASSLTVFRLRK